MKTQWLRLAIHVMFCLNRCTFASKSVTCLAGQTKQRNLWKNEGKTFFPAEHELTMDVYVNEYNDILKICILDIDIRFLNVG